MKPAGLLLRHLTLTAAAFGFVACRGDKATGISNGADGGLRFAAVSVGGYFACAVAMDGAAYCWGDNFGGQLGIGTDEIRRTPTAVGGGLRFAAVTTGLRHTCALSATGAAYCWGENDAGQLGVEGTGEWGRPNPLAVSGPHRFAAITAGASHTCALTQAGAAYCWGDNGYGELGDGGTTSSNAPVAVAGGHTFAAISPGRGYTCAITTAAVAYCWGANVGGLLGVGSAATGPSKCSSPCSPIPAAVVGGLAFSSISAAGGHICGVATDGATYCWGANGAGQLGDGTTTPRTSPVPVTGGTTFVTVRTGSDGLGNGHTCAVTAAGAAYCWGRNEFGQLGDGTTTDRAIPVRVSGGLAFVALSAGESLTCGRTAGGLVYCWGSNSNGALGTGSTERESPVPVRVGGQS